MNQSNEIKSIAKLGAAMSNLQGDMTGALKDSNNPFFNSSYADFASCFSSINTFLKLYGLAFTQNIFTKEYTTANGPAFVDFIETMVMHVSGEHLNLGPLKIACKDPSNPQAVGSSQTYYRRYHLCAAFGISQVDDDANASSQNKAQPIAKPAAKPVPQKAAPIKDVVETKPKASPIFSLAMKKNISKDQFMIILKELGAKHTSDLSQDDEKYLTTKINDAINFDDLLFTVRNEKQFQAKI